MAAPKLFGESNKFVWDDGFTRLTSTANITSWSPIIPPLNLAPWNLPDLTTSVREADHQRETRMKELELELAAWKQAHATLLESVERERKAHNVQIASFNRHFASLDFFKNQSPLILCIINGDENVFPRSLLLQGQIGGRQAAQSLTKAIAEYLANEDLQVLGRLSFWITIYYNKRNLLELLLENDICAAEQFEAFLSGFSETSPRFTMVDVGFNKGATVSKVIEHVQAQARYPQTLRVFLGSNGSGPEFSTSFAALDREGLLGKVVLMRDLSRQPSPDLRLFGVLSLDSHGIFMTERLAPVTKRPPSLVPVPLPNSGTVTTHGGLISPQTSESQFSATNNGFQPIDPTKPLHKQTPPPCNEFYLMNCSKGPSCKYSHDWYLSQEQLVTLAKNAKKAPCNFYKNGMECPNRSSCCWGHVCPNGSKCFHYTKGKCWFKGANMHPEES